MAKLQVVMADPDEMYLLTLERKAIEDFGEDAELHTITQVDFFESFFSSPRRLDLLVIHESWYRPELEKHNIGHIFILSESEEVQDYNFAKYTQLYKYTSVKEIFSKITGRAGSLLPLGKENRKTTVILVYSPAGGSGQTTLALGLCAAFAKSFKRVLFLSTDSLQSFLPGMELENRLKPGAEKALLSKSDYAYETLKPFITETDFCYLPPFSSALPFLGIGATQICDLIDGAVRSDEYDYIVVDGPDDFSPDTTALMAKANHTMLVARQNMYSALKMHALLENIDCSDHQRFSFVCNQYQREKENHLITNGMVGGHVCEYVGVLPEEVLTDTGALGNIDNIQKLALSFM